MNDRRPTLDQGRSGRDLEGNAVVVVHLLEDGEFVAFLQSQWSITHKESRSSLADHVELPQLADVDLVQAGHMLGLVTLLVPLFVHGFAVVVEDVLVRVAHTRDDPTNGMHRADLSNFAEVLTRLCGRERTAGGHCRAECKSQPQHQDQRGRALPTNCRLVNWAGLAGYRGDGDGDGACSIECMREW